jgi:hypothetical protein
MVPGVTDCMSEKEKNGIVRGLSLGRDRTGREFLFLSRRLFVFVWEAAKFSIAGHSVY